MTTVGAQPAAARCGASRRTRCDAALESGGKCGLTMSTRRAVVIASCRGHPLIQRLVRADDRGVAEAALRLGADRGAIDLGQPPHERTHLVHGVAEKPGPAVYFDTDNIDESIKKVRDLGGKADEKLPIPFQGWFAGCTDTEGNTFSLFQNDPSVTMETEQQSARA